VSSSNATNGETVRRAPTTISDIAEAVGVSLATVSRALNGTGSISTTMRRRVEDAAYRLNYQVNLAARTARTGLSGTLGLIITAVGEPYYAAVTRGFSDKAREAGYQVVVANTDEDPIEESRAFRTLLQSRVEGIALTPALGTSVVELQAATDVPLVTIDRRVRGLSVDTVMSETREAAHEATFRLLESGHRRIGMVTGRSAALSTGLRGVTAPRDDGNPGSDRLDGFVQALGDYGLPIRTEWLLRTDYRLDRVKDAVAGLLSSPDRPTALFVSDSHHALGAYLGIQAAGLRVPDDISMTTIDDSPLAAAVGLSVMEQPAPELGRAAADRLLVRIRGDAGPPVDVRMGCTWIGRSSVDPVPTDT
jgi:LacI family transcriptional regulator